MGEGHILTRAHTIIDFLGVVAIAIRSDAQRRAVAKYNAANYEQIQLRVKTGRKVEIKAHAESRGESLNEFINRAIDETIEREGA